MQRLTNGIQPFLASWLQRKIAKRTEFTSKSPEFTIASQGQQLKCTFRIVWYSASSNTDLVLLYPVNVGPPAWHLGCKIWQNEKSGRPSVFLLILVFLLVGVKPTNQHRHGGRQPRRCLGFLYIARLESFWPAMVLPVQTFY